MKLSHQSEKYSENINQLEMILWCPENNFVLIYKQSLRQL